MNLWTEFEEVIINRWVISCYWLRSHVTLCSLLIIIAMTILIGFIDTSCSQQLLIWLFTYAGWSYSCAWHTCLSSRPCVLFFCRCPVSAGLNCSFAVWLQGKDGKCCHLSLSGEWNKRTTPLGSTEFKKNREGNCYLSKHLRCYFWLSRWQHYTFSLNKHFTLHLPALKNLARWRLMIFFWILYEKYLYFFHIHFCNFYIKKLLSIMNYYFFYLSIFLWIDCLCGWGWLKPMVYPFTINARIK